MTTKKQELTRVQPIGLAQRVQQPTGSRSFAVPVHSVFNSNQQQNSNSNNNANQRNAKRSKKTLFATTGATASAVRVGQGGKRHTKKKHNKRKKHGTQKKRSH